MATAVQDRSAREETYRQKWEGFPEDVKVRLGELESAVKRRSLQNVQEWWAQNRSLGALGITVDAQVSVHGNRALHDATCRGRVEIVRYLVDVCGADINIKNAYSGCTSLMLAARNDQPACVRALLELGADASLRDDDEGKTAFEWARERLSVESLECMDILEEWVPMPSVKSALKA